MITIDHRTSTDLTADEKRELRQRQVAKNQFVSSALSALSALTTGNASSRDISRAVAILRQEPHPSVPQAYVVAAPASRPTSASLRSSNGPRKITDGCSSTPGDHSDTKWVSTRNSEYERLLALREEPDDFYIPVKRPLPLSYEAQCDQRYLTGAPRRNSLHAVSDFAPLFTRSARPMSATEKERLGFLVPPRDSPKEQTLRVLQERHQYDRHCDPDAKILFNTPKQLPNLNQKVAADFVPECAAKLTVSADMRFSGNVIHINEVCTTTRDAQGRAAWR